MGLFDNQHARTASSASEMSNQIVRVRIVNSQSADVLDDTTQIYQLVKVGKDGAIVNHVTPFNDNCDADVENQSSGSSQSNSETNWVHRTQQWTVSWVSKHEQLVVRAIVAVLLAAYTAYFVCAILYSVDMAVALIVLTGLAVLGVAYMLIRDHFGQDIYKYCLQPIEELIVRTWPVTKWFVYPIIIIAIIVYLALDVVTELRQLQPLIGFVIFILTMFITSKHPDKVIWRPVLWGFILQFLLAIFVLRWEYGYIAVKWLSDAIMTFIYFGFEGAAVVFGDPFLVFHPFAFMGMPILIYLGSVMAILYYWGLTQWAACKLGWLMQISLGTTAIESLNTAANIFLDGMDTMLMLRHYIDKLTRSEFNCFLVGNHATVAGFVFAIFVMFGAPPQHLLSAAVMSAPATIAICKLNWPETEESITKEIDEIELTEGDDINVFEAAANGAAVASKTVGAVVACYIAFLSMLAFINACLSWFGGLVGFPELSFELICSYVMWPVAYIIGIEEVDCQESAKLIGLKLFATEILAYQELGKSVDAGRLNARSQALTTYAMCGFSSISTLAIAIGVWNSICPQRVKQMASQMFRTLCQANISCFMTACVAGLFYSEELMSKWDAEESTPQSEFITFILSLIPSYKDLMDLVGM